MPWPQRVRRLFLFLTICTVLVQGIKVLIKHRKKEKDMKLANIVKRPSESFNLDDDFDEEAPITMVRVDRVSSFKSPRNKRLNEIFKPSTSGSFNFDTDDMSCKGESSSVSKSMSGSRGGSSTLSAASPRTMKRSSTIEDRKKKTGVSIWEGGSRGMARSTSRSTEYARNGSGRGSGKEREEKSEGEKGGGDDLDIMAEINMGFL